MDKIKNWYAIKVYNLYEYLADYFDNKAEQQFKKKCVMYHVITSRLDSIDIKSLIYAAKKEENYELLDFLKKNNYI